ncbi:unnamed protein product [Vitrella brassicaformis CCMP3155]|uniref:CBM20 domain-containing protein n=1 Tax=Vitrella brassicaformis (strain CCMP3155) TaxID=1169540 RepID=A0A0G4EKW7_VITBC|nr:unnamed protein product [Vitrella brassicaformis CCMP3155]|eukprot:CEL98035.1 unnamed protein product [Vitrella brassicaformis CCMP3155]
MMKLYTKVFFRAVFNTDFGERVRVVGDSPLLGSWDPKKGHELKTSEELFPSWFSLEPILLPIKEKVQYKYVIVDETGKLINWEEIEDNRELVPTGVEMTVEDDNGLYREQTQSHLESYSMALDAEQQLVTDSKQREDQVTQARVTYVHQQEMDSMIDENDTLLVVSFELPVKVSKSEDGQFVVTPGKTALLPTLYQQRKKTKIPVKTIGWPGIHVEDPRDQEEIERLLADYDCHPVFPPKKELDEYLAFCHRFLWPLFHNVVILDTHSQQPFNNEQWGHYQAMNRLWAEAVVRVAHETDLIWVHDYHLLVAPLFITRRIRKANVGLFLHIPFPSSEIFRCLPVREEILRGMLCADLIGFHFFEYARHFLVACKRLLGIEHHCRMGGFLGLEYGGRSVMLRIGHVHIQYDDLRTMIESSDEIKRMTQDIRSKYEGRYIFASVDRCERLAGLILKMRAFQNFLNTYPYAQGKVVLIQYAYPTISYWDDTSRMRRELTNIVDKINTDFQDLDEGRGASGHTSEFHHVVFQVKEVTREEKYALFQAADCLLDTSIRDGLNLNPFEYICCRKDEPGAIILSEFTGCSRALASALRVNPWKIENVSEAMDRAMNSTFEESRDRFLRDQNYLQHGSTLRWAEEFLLDLRRSRKREDMLYVSWGFGAGYRVLGMDQHFRHLEVTEVIQAFRKAKNRIFFFDHEGTLAPDRRRITAIPGENLFSQGSGPSKAVQACLQTLCKDPRNTVVILSGRDKESIEAWFGGIENIGLAAEHGFYYKVPTITGNQWYCMSQNVDYTWKQIAVELMMQYVKRTQGSFIENKGSALVFQYRDSDPDFGQWQAKELSNYLSELLFGYPVSVMTGKGYVEVKLRGVNKGVAVQKVLSKLTKINGEVDFILCIGDDRSDEDMFSVVNNLTSQDEGSEDFHIGRTTSQDPHVPQRRRSQDHFRLKGGQRTPSDGLSTKLGSPSPAVGVQSNSPSLPHSKPPPSPMLPLPASAQDGIRADTSATTLTPGKAAAQTTYFTCTVGKKPSHARCYLNDTDEVSELLEALQLFTTKHNVVGSSSTVPYHISYMQGHSPRPLAADVFFGVEDESVERKDSL